MSDDNVLAYVPIEQARAMPGLRVGFTQGVPGPWSVSAKAILDFKGIDYVAFAQVVGGDDTVLKEWTGQTSAPVAMLDDDKPRPHWSEILMLAEELRPEPRLLPLDYDERLTVLGLCNELCNEDGFGWNVRLVALSGERGPPRDSKADWLRAKYRSPVSTEHARTRINAILAQLAARLERQAASGSRYLVGNELSAADIYWAAFSNLVSGMTPDLCTMPDYYRELGAVIRLYFDEPVPQILYDHRDYVVRT